MEITKERLSNYLSYKLQDLQNPERTYESAQDELFSIIANLQGYLKDNMFHRGLDELDSYVSDYADDIIENELDVSDVINKTFEGAYINGTLTFSTFQAEQELLACFDMSDLIEFAAEHGYKEISAETLHILKTEEMVREELYDIYDDLENVYDYPFENEGEKTLVAVCDLLRNNGFTCDYGEKVQEKIKAFQQEEEESNDLTR